MRTSEPSSSSSIRFESRTSLDNSFCSKPRRIRCETVCAPISNPSLRKVRSASPGRTDRSEEHTSELQSRLHLVCRLLLEKKKPIRSSAVSRLEERLMSKTKKILIGSAVAVVLLVVLMGSLRGKDRNLPRVTTAKVEKADLIAKVTANGKIQARRKVDMSALVMGQIVNLAVKEGDQV